MQRLHYLRWLPDQMYLRLLFKWKMGYRLNLKKPETFAEKLQWLKLYDRKPIYHQMVDKVESKGFISRVIGDGYTIPTLGVYDSFEQIDWDELPQQFILKATHDSGSYYIINDKNNIDKQTCKKHLYLHWQKDYYNFFREWQYKGLKSRIIAEPLIAEPHSLKEFNFFCFNGEPKFFQSIKDRDSTKGRPILQHFDINGKRMEMSDAIYKSRQDYGIDNELPVSLDTMIKFSKMLSKDTFFLRVDFFEVDGKFYLGELTLHESAGFCLYNPVSWNNILGEWLHLPIDS